MGESIELYEGTKKIWEIRKEYEDAAFDDDVTSLGCKINVFQETINKMFPEYLVNFDYLERIMENYGFKLVTRDEAKSLGLPEGSGLFSELYNLLQDEVKRRPFKKNEYGDALEMSPNEKKISFLNRYFAFKKISHVNAEKVAMELIDDTVTERKVSRASVVPTPVKKPAKKSEKTLERKKARPLNKKIMLIAASEAIDEPEEKPEPEPEPEVNIVVEKPAAVEKKARKPRAKKVVLAVNSETKEQAKENAEEVKEKALEEQQNEKEVYETEGTIIKESETPALKKKAASKKKVTLKLEE